MLFGKKERLVGLDIGSKTIKVAEIAESNGKLKLIKFGVTDFPPDVIDFGTIKDHEAASNAIRGLFKAYNIKTQNVALSIGGYSVIIKKIIVQTMTEEALQETIQFEAEQYIPFDISEVNLDFQILGNTESNPNQMNVLLVAAKKEMVNDYLNLVQMAGLTPCLVDVDAFALQNIFEFNYDVKNDNVALIDIGASKTSLNILKGDTSVFMRDVSLGCGQINQKIVSKIGCSLDEAEQIKMSDKNDALSKENLNAIVTSVVGDWCIEIRRALDFFYSTYPEDQIQRIVLSGGGANIDEFRQLLAAETSAGVEKINPFQKVSVDDDLIDKSYLEQISPQAAICMGLSIRKVDDK